MLYRSSAFGDFPYTTDALGIRVGRDLWSRGEYTQLDFPVVYTYVR